jgi:hypothetical protein
MNLMPLDLAPATGQPYAAAPENLEASWQMVSNTPTIRKSGQQANDQLDRESLSVGEAPR